MATSGLGHHDDPPAATVWLPKADLSSQSRMPKGLGTVTLKGFEGPVRVHGI
jgi:hypothetical protein